MPVSWDVAVLWLFFTIGGMLLSFFYLVLGSILLDMLIRIDTSEAILLVLTVMISFVGLGIMLYFFMVGALKAITDTVEEIVPSNSVRGNYTEVTTSKTATPQVEIANKSSFEPKSTPIRGKLESWGEPLLYFAIGIIILFVFFVVLSVLQELSRSML